MFCSSYKIVLLFTVWWCIAPFALLIMFTFEILWMFAGQWMRRVLRRGNAGQVRVLPHHATSRSATSPTIGRRIWVSFPSCRPTMFRSFLCLLSFLFFHPACSSLSIFCIALGIDLQKSCPGWKWWDKWSWDFAFWKELEVPEELDVSLRLLYLELLGIYETSHVPA